MLESRRGRIAASTQVRLTALAAALLLSACSERDNAATGPAATGRESAAAPVEAAKAGNDLLAGTRWQLVEFQSMDDAQGVTSAGDSSLYTMDLNADGSVAMRLNCNRASGTWMSEASADASNGRFAFGPLAMTRAYCPPPSLDGQIARQAEYVRGYLLKDGRLYLSLMADGGIYVFEPRPQ